MRKFFIPLAFCLLTACGLYLSQLSFLSPTPKIDPAHQSTNLPQHYVLIILDTVGAKHLDLTSSNGPLYLQKLAAESIVYTNAYSAAPWTRPAIGSIFTGLHPQLHGITRLRDAFKPEVKTLAQAFKEKGYKSAGYVSHELINQKTDFKRGFDTYRMVDIKGDVHDAISSPQVSDGGISWMDSHIKEHSSTPFFLFLHYFDPHYNYRHHPEYDRTSWYKGPLYSNMHFSEVRSSASKLTADDIRYLAGLHAEEIAFTDSHIARVFEFIKNTPSLQNTTVIVTADHGEEFHEHGGIGHGVTLYDEVIHVPLLVWSPSKQVGKVVTRWVSTMDIAPTILGTIPQSETQDIQGYPLFEFSSDTKAIAPESRHLSVHVAHRARLQALLQSPFKFITKTDGGAEEFYDLLSDATEKENLITTHTKAQNFREQQKGLEHLLKNPDTATWQKLTSEEDSSFDAEEAEKLKSLGYLG